MTAELPTKLSALAASSSMASAFLAMTDAVSISIVTSLSAVLMAGISAYFSYKAKTIAETTGKAVDGHLTEFKTMAKEKFTTEGVLQEKQEETLRKADAVIAKAEGVVQEKADEQSRQKNL